MQRPSGLRKLFCLSKTVSLLETKGGDILSSYLFSNLHGLFYFYQNIIEVLENCIFPYIFIPCLIEFTLLWYVSIKQLRATCSSPSFPKLPLQKSWAVSVSIISYYAWHVAFTYQNLYHISNIYFCLYYSVLVLRCSRQSIHHETTIPNRADSFLVGFINIVLICIFSLNRISSGRYIHPHINSTHILLSTMAEYASPEI